MNYMCVINSKVTKVFGFLWLEDLFSGMWWQEVRLVLTLTGFSFTVLYCEGPSLLQHCFLVHLLE